MTELAKFTKKLVAAPYCFFFFNYLFFFKKKIIVIQLAKGFLRAVAGYVSLIELGII
jgi:hypothetical protein